jgi:hypothetical protein
MQSAWLVCSMLALVVARSFTAIFSSHASDNG